MGVGPSGAGKAQSAKASSMVLMLFLLLHRHAAPIEIARNQVHIFAKHHGSNREDELFPSTTFFWRRYC